MKIIWTESALRDLNKAIDYTENYFPEKKKDLKKIIESLSSQLKLFPFMGTGIDFENNLFRIPLKTFPFAITYQKKEKSIYIISFVHQSQNWQ